jgi:hypothetical protein
MFVYFVFVCQFAFSFYNITDEDESSSQQEQLTLVSSTNIIPLLYPVSAASEVQSINDPNGDQLTWIDLNDKMMLESGPANGSSPSESVSAGQQFVSPPLSPSATSSSTPPSLTPSVIVNMRPFPFTSLSIPTYTFGYQIYDFYNRGLWIDGSKQNSLLAPRLGRPLKGSSGISSTAVDLNTLLKDVFAPNSPRKYRIYPRQLDVMAHLIPGMECYALFPKTTVFYPGLFGFFLLFALS